MDLLWSITYLGTARPACSIPTSDVDAVSTASRDPVSIPGCHLQFHPQPVTAENCLTVQHWNLLQVLRKV